MQNNSLTPDNTIHLTSTKGESCHYFASTFIEWAVAENSAEAIQRAARSIKKGQKYVVNVARVKLPISAQYKICDYVPVVDPSLIEFVQLELIK